jgi:hypothetical protein
VAASPKVFPRTGPLAAVSTSTGALAESFPEVAGGSIDAITSDGNGGYFIGGNFTHVDGVAIYGLAHILPDHALDTSWNAGVSPGVVISALGLEEGVLYVGIGLFGSEPVTNYVGDLNNGTITRYYMAALNAANAQATAWAPNLNGNVYSVLTTPTSIYIGGNFSSANGAVRSHLAALDPAVGSGASQTLAWNPEMSNGVSAYPAAISDSTVYIAGIFYEVGGVSRNGIAAVDAASGALDANWNPDPGSGLSRRSLSQARTSTSGEASSRWRARPATMQARSRRPHRRRRGPSSRTGIPTPTTASAPWPSPDRLSISAEASREPTTSAAAQPATMSQRSLPRTGRQQAGIRTQAALSAPSSRPGARSTHSCRVDRRSISAANSPDLARSTPAAKSSALASRPSTRQAGS